MRSLAGLLIVTLAGCSVEGTYVLDRAESEKATDPAMVNPNAPRVDATLVLGSAGTAILQTTMFRAGKAAEAGEQTWKWKKEGDVIHIDTAEGDGMTCTKTGNVLTCSRAIPDAKRTIVDTLIFTKS